VDEGFADFFKDFLFGRAVAHGCCLNFTAPATSGKQGLWDKAGQKSETFGTQPKITLEPARRRQLEPHSQLLLALVQALC
jgi:hypothetical protein